MLGPAGRRLFILDSFTHADGSAGARTRTSYGYDDMPIFAQVGVWREDGRRRGFAGILVSGADPVEARAMPVILPPDHDSAWLQAEVGISGWNLWRDVSRTLYREATPPTMGPQSVRLNKSQSARRLGFQKIRLAVPISGRAAS